MARIFLSHSSGNNAQARALGDWLAANGWPADDVFLDIDPTGGIAPGERWQRALNDAATRCEAVIFLVSPEWLASRWCREELSLAHKLNKRLFGVIVGPVGMDEIPGMLRDEWQLIDLEGERDGQRFDVDLPGGREGHATFSRSGLEKLRLGLVKAGLDPSYFPWPPPAEPDRTPYRGLAPMEAEDAGIFYGREAATIAALDRLRGLAEAPPPRLMAILGASGAGKSSFMRAGLIPRLKRDDRHFLVLPVLRPQRAALTGDTGLVASLAGAGAEAGLKWTRAQVAKAVASGADAVVALLDELAAAAMKALAVRDDAEPPMVVLPLDQAEELFLAEGRAEAQQALELLAELMRRGAVAVLATIRTDSYEQMQNAPALADIPQATFSLAALARGAYQRVIEGPAERLRGTQRALKIEPALTAALLADIEAGGAKDALPLLAFTLERLYRDHGSDGDLTLAEYREAGGIAGAIEAAVERALAAADHDPAVPREREARLALLRRAIIPWLAGIDPETGTPRRQVARLSDIPDEARPLIGHFVDQRLLSTDVSPLTGERTVEPAHEALLRQWGLVDGWLKEDVAVLATLEGVRRAVRDWDANGRAPAWLAHGGARLEDAEAVRSRADLARRLDATDLEYLAACRAAEKARTDRELRAARRIRIGAIAASVMAVVAAGAAGAAWWSLEQARESERVAKEALIRSEELGEQLGQESAQRGIQLGDSLIDRGQPDTAALLLLDAADRLGLRGGDNPAVSPAVTQDLRIALDRVGEIFASRAVVPVAPGRTAFEGPDGLYLVDPATLAVERFTQDGLHPFSSASEEPAGPILKASVSADRKLTMVLEDGRVLRAEEGMPVRLFGKLTSGDEKIEDWSVSISRDGSVAGWEEEIFIDSDGTAVTTPEDVSTRHYLRSADGRRFFWGGTYVEDNGSVEVSEILREGDRIAFETKILDDATFSPIEIFSCFYEGLSTLPPEKLAITFDNGGAVNRSCRWYDVDDTAAAIYSNRTEGSGGVFLNHEVFTEFGEPTTAEELIRSVSGIQLDESTIGWIGVDRVNGRIGAIAGRTVLIFDQNRLLLGRKHNGRPGAAHFLEDGRLAVMDTETNAVVTYDPTPAPFMELSSGEPYDTLHEAFCDGDEFEIRPGLRAAIAGTDLTLKTAGTEVSLTIEDGNCLRRSFDGSLLLALDREEGGQLRIYDVAGLLTEKAVTPANSSTLPGNVDGAFFVADGSVVTSDGTFIVRRWMREGPGGWTSSQIYDGDRPLIDAEPSKDASLLILREHLGGSYFRALLYGVFASRQWKDLGTEYKHIEATFAPDGAVLVQKSEKLSRIELKSIPQLVEIVGDGLSPQCRPAVAGDYASSPCWPN